MILASGALLSIVVIGALLLGLGAIILGVIMFKRHSKYFQERDKKPDEETIVKEELNRVLEDVTDEETKKAMMDFEKNKTQNEKKDNK